MGCACLINESKPNDEIVVSCDLNKSLNKKNENYLSHDHKSINDNEITEAHCSQENINIKPRFNKFNFNSTSEDTYCVNKKIKKINKRSVKKITKHKLSKDDISEGKTKKKDMKNCGPILRYLSSKKNQKCKIDK